MLELQRGARARTTSEGQKEGSEHGHHWREGYVATHFTWKPDWPAVRQLLLVIEKELGPFKARPHWRKLFSMGQPALATLYDRLPDFRRQLAEYDP